jgi:hypothetical protein
MGTGGTLSESCRQDHWARDRLKCINRQKRKRLND